MTYSLNKAHGVATAMVAALVLAMLTLSSPALAQSQHEQILQNYGGEYDPNGVGHYVRGIVDRLEPHADLRRPIRYVTVLNTPVVNAFATPEGGVYVTRGIVALANSEDELAGVIGHEIAHVAEGHGQQRQSASLVAGLLGLALQAAGVGDMGMLGYNIGANLGLAGYSRDQEQSSDRLGVEYLYRAGYDPFALHDFFQSMRLNEQLSQQLAGRDTFNSRMDFFSTHPNTEGRMEDVYNTAAGWGIAEGGRPRIVRPFFDEIDGMLYGDSAEQGFVRGQSFVHPDLRFAYDVPDGYTIQNGQSSVNAFHQDGSNIYFDMAQIGGQTYGSTGKGPGNNRRLGDYLRTTMANDLGAQLSNIQTFRLNGINAASGNTTLVQNNQRREAFVVVYEGDNHQVFRFVMSGPRNGRSFDQRGWVDTMDSFRRLNDYDLVDLQPLTVSIVRTRRGDTVSSMANRLAFDDFQEQRFRTLNGLTANERLPRGVDVKIVVD